MTGKKNSAQASRPHARGLAAMVLSALLAGCVTGSGGSENFLTIFVDNFEGQAVVVSIAEDTWCQVDARLTRHQCRFAWAGTGNLNLQVSNPSRGSNEVARAEGVSGGDRMCLQVRDTGIQLRRC